jgi:hypothetical protein
MDMGHVPPDGRYALLSFPIAVEGRERQKLGVLAKAR